MPRLSRGNGRTAGPDEALGTPIGQHWRSPLALLQRGVPTPQKFCYRLPSSVRDPSRLFRPALDPRPKAERSPPRGGSGGGPPLPAKFAKALKFANRMRYDLNADRSDYTQSLIERFRAPPAAGVEEEPQAQSSPPRTAVSFFSDKTVAENEDRFEVVEFEPNGTTTSMAGLRDLGSADAASVGTYATIHWEQVAPLDGRPPFTASGSRACSPPIHQRDFQTLQEICAHRQGPGFTTVKMPVKRRPSINDELPPRPSETPRRLRPPRASTQLESPVSSTGAESVPQPQLSRSRRATAAAPDFVRPLTAVLESAMRLATPTDFEFPTLTGLPSLRSNSSSRNAAPRPSTGTGMVVARQHALQPPPREEELAAAARGQTPPINLLERRLTPDVSTRSASSLW